jgi:hypothetical protein
LRELVPARRARCDEDREPALVDRLRERVELHLAQAVIGARAILPGDQAELAHHPTVHPLVIRRRVANMQERPVRDPRKVKLARRRRIHLGLGWEVERSIAACHEHPLLIGDAGRPDQTKSRSITGGR